MYMYVKYQQKKDRFKGESCYTYIYNTSGKRTGANVTLAMLHTSRKGTGSKVNQYQQKKDKFKGESCYNNYYI